MCKHEEFDAAVVVARLEDVGRFVADVRIHCRQCKLPFQFLGLEPGLNMNGTAVSPDGLEARMAITPKGQVPNPIQAMGYVIHKHNG